MKPIQALLSTLLLGASFTTSAWSFAIPLGTPYCFGDGSTGVACPCANFSPLGNNEGCLNSLGVGGKLIAVNNGGIPSISADLGVSDPVRLIGTQMPNSTCIYFQGSQTSALVPFGDGLRCVNNPFLARLGIKFNVANSSQYGAPGDQPVALQGVLVTPLAVGDTRSYHVWYRNAALYCMPQTFNITNAVEITWTF